MKFIFYRRFRKVWKTNLIVKLSVKMSSLLRQAYFFCLVYSMLYLLQILETVTLLLVYYLISITLLHWTAMHQSKSVLPLIGCTIDVYLHEANMSCISYSKMHFLSFYWQLNIEIWWSYNSITTYSDLSKSVINLNEQLIGIKHQTSLL